MSSSLGIISARNVRIGVPRSSASNIAHDDATPSDTHKTVFSVPLSDALLYRIFLSNCGMSAFHSVLMIVTLSIGNLSLRAPLYATDIEFVDTNLTSGLAFELVPSYVKYTSIPLTVVTAAFFACSALAHAGNAFVWRSFYESRLAECSVPTRWVEYFFSASIMFILISYGAAVREFNYLIALTGLVASTMLFGWITEYVARPVSNTSWNLPLRERLTFHVMGYIPQTFAWACILAGFYDQQDAERAPAFVYAIIWSQLFLFGSFGLVQLAQQISVPEKYYRGEVAYQVLSLTTKGVLGGLFLANVLLLDRVEDAY